MAAKKCTFTACRRNRLPGIKFCEYHEWDEDVPADEVLGNCSFCGIPVGGHEPHNYSTGTLAHSDCAASR